MSGSDQDKYNGSFEQKSDLAANEQPPSLEGDVPEYDKHTESKLIRKIDHRLLPILGALYSIALIDRVNVGKQNSLVMIDADKIRYLMLEWPVWEKILICRLGIDIRLPSWCSSRHTCCLR